MVKCVKHHSELNNVCVTPKNIGNLWISIKPVSLIFLLNVRAVTYLEISG